MNKLAISLILIVAGAAAIYVGMRRSDSVAGVSDSVGAKIANTFDGKTRQPEHVWYYVGGGILIVAGIAGALKK